MLLRRAHVIRLQPTAEQEDYFRRACGVRRWVYNWALGEWEAWYTLYGKSLKRPSWQKLDAYFNSIKDSICPWSREVAAAITNRAIQNVNTAYVRWFESLKKGDNLWGKPRPTKKGRNERFYINSRSLKFVNRQVFVEKCGWVRCREDFRWPNAKIMSGAIKQKPEGWYISVQCEFEQDIPEHSGPPVGLDLGVVRTVTLSDDRSFVLPTDQLAELDRRIRNKQRTASRRRPKPGVRGSNRYRKALTEVSRLRRKQALIRNHHLHQFSRQIVDEFSTVCIEDLDIKQMTRSAKGTKEKPGTGVAVKAELNRRILESGMGEFRRLLEYKSEAAGGMVIPVEAAYTSQQCSECGYTDASNRKDQATFKCGECGCEMNADLNAARNILKKGTSVEKQ